MIGSFDRTDEALEAARFMLSPFRKAGYHLIPLARGQKRPRDTGWQAKDYLFADIGRWMKRGGNVGIALRPCDLVIDIDPRNGGEESFGRLCADVGVDLSLAPTVLSGRGDGGRHVYFRKPTALRIHGKLGAYPGIDFKSKGGLVVGPGSIHPETGGVYVTDDFTLPFTDVRPAPRTLLVMLRRSAPAVVAGDRIGKVSNARLAELLAVLDPTAYGHGHHDEWLALSAACHDATAGGGLIEWLVWCARDLAYADDDTRERNIRRWQSFEAGKPGGATYRTLFKAVSDAGRPDLVAALGDDGDDSIEEDFLVHEIETETDHD